MRRVKSLVFLAVLAMVVFGLVATANAATFSDAGKFATPVAKLTSLGITNGYPDGTIKPDQPITRAEFAKIVVTELNLGNSVVSGTTQFGDVAADHWASGYINLAVGQGLIKGYPDGTFKPDANVTNAEAVTMVVRMLGFAPAMDESNWPASYMSKAASLGLFDGVSGIKANDASTRGNVFAMASNALDANVMKQTGWGTEIRYEELSGAADTILQDKFDLTIVDDDYVKDQKWDRLPKVIETPSLDTSSYKANEMKLDKLGKVYEVADGINPNAWLGQQVSCWIDNNDVIVYIEPDDEQTVINDKIDTLFTDGSDYKIKLDSNDKEYVINDDASTWKSITTYASGWKAAYDANAGWQGTALNGNRIKLVLNDTDKVVSIVISNPSAYGYLVKSIDAGDEVVYYRDWTGNETSKDFSDEDYLLYKNGAPASLGDLKEGDVLHIFECQGDASTNGYYLVATDKRVKGTVDNVETSNMDSVKSYDIYVGEKKYDASFFNHVGLSTDNMETMEEAATSDLYDLAGVDAELILNAAGEVAYVVASAELAGENVGVISATPAFTISNKKYNMSIVNKSGSEVTYAFDLADVDVYQYVSGDKKAVVDGADADTNADNEKLTALTFDSDANKLIAVLYKVNSNNELTEVTIINNKPGFAGPKVDLVPDDNDNTLDGYRVTDSTVFFDIHKSVNLPGITDDKAHTTYDIDDVDVASWDSVKSKSKVDVAYYATEDRVKYAFVTKVSGTLTTEGDYAVVKGFTRVNGDDALKMLVWDADAKKSVEKTYVNNESTPNKGDFIRFELNSSNEIDKIDVLVKPNTGYLYAGSLTDINLETVVDKVYVSGGSTSSVRGDTTGTADTSDDSYYITNSNTVYYDIHDTGNLKITSGVTAGQRVTLIDTDDDGQVYNMVVIFSKP